MGNNSITRFDLELYRAVKLK